MPWGLSIAPAPAQAKSLPPEQLCGPSSPVRHASRKASKHRSSHHKRTARIASASDWDDSLPPTSSSLEMRYLGVEPEAIASVIEGNWRRGSAKSSQSMDDTDPCTLPELTAVFRFRQWKRRREEAAPDAIRTFLSRSANDKETCQSVSQECFLAALSQLQSWRVSSHRGTDTLPHSDDASRVLSIVVSYVSSNVAAQSPSMLSLIAAAFAQASSTTRLAVLRPHNFFIELLFGCSQSARATNVGDTTHYLRCASIRVATLCAAIANCRVSDEILVETVINVAERAFQSECHREADDTRPVVGDAMDPSTDPPLSCAQADPLAMSPLFPRTPTMARRHPRFALDTITSTPFRPFQSRLFSRLITDAPLVPLLHELSLSVREKASAKIVEAAARHLLGRSASDDGANVLEYHRLLRYETTLLDELLHS